MKRGAVRFLPAWRHSSTRLTDCKLGGGIGVHTGMDGCASCGGYGNDRPYASELLDQIVNLKVGPFDVGLLRIC